MECKRYLNYSSDALRKEADDREDGLSGVMSRDARICVGRSGFLEKLLQKFYKALKHVGVDEDGMFAVMQDEVFLQDKYLQGTKENAEMVKQMKRDDAARQVKSHRRELQDHLGRGGEEDNQPWNEVVNAMSLVVATFDNLETEMDMMSRSKLPVTDEFVDSCCYCYCVLIILYAACSALQQEALRRDCDNSGNFISIERGHRCRGSDLGIHQGSHRRDETKDGGNVDFDYDREGRKEEGSRKEVEAEEVEAFHSYREATPLVKNFISNFYNSKLSLTNNSLLTLISRYLNGGLIPSLSYFTEEGEQKTENDVGLNYEPDWTSARLGIGQQASPPSIIIFTFTLASSPSPSMPWTHHQRLP